MTTTERAQAPVNRHETEPAQNTGLFKKIGNFVSEHKLGTTVAGAAGAGLATGALIFGGHNGEVHVKVGETAPGTSNSYDIESGPEAANTLSPEAVQTLAAFDQNRAVYLTHIKADMEANGYTPDRYNLYKDATTGADRSIEAASVDMTPQAIVDRNMAKMRMLTEATDKSAAANQSDIVAQPGSDAYEQTADRVAKPDAVVAISDEDMVSGHKRFTEGTFYDEAGHKIVSADGKPTELIAAMNVRTRDGHMYAFQWDADASGKTGEWRLVSEANKPGEFGYVDPTRIDSIQIR